MTDENTEWDGVLDRPGIVVRREVPADAKAVFELNKRAFGSAAESRLVDRLRRLATPYVSLVAVVSGRVAGHIFFSPVTVQHAAADVLCMGLGPMAVLPDLQNRGVGSKLMERGLSACSDLGVAAVFVLGHPDYYPRFGFRNAAGSGFRYEDQRYDPYFFVLEQCAGFLDNASGLVQYHPAFSSL